MKTYCSLLITSISFLILQQQAIAQATFDQFSKPASEIVDSIYSASLVGNREFWVKLPENYNPVLYLLDGYSLKNQLEAVYDNYWGHYLPHMILVGVSNRTNRTRDLTTSQVKKWGSKEIDQNTGGADKFTDFLEKELIPHIDSKYPTTPYRTLIGHSYGGLFTINTLINHSHLFENYIAIDPSLEWDNQKLLKQAKEKLKTENYKQKSLFVSLASEQLHMYNEAVTMENVMEDSSEFTLFARSIIDFSNFATAQKQSGLNFSWKVYPEDLHGTVPLPSMRDGLVFLFKWYQFKSPQKYNKPETSIKELLELLKAQGAIYAAHFGYAVPPLVAELLSGYGYMNMQMEQPDKAKMFFEKYIAYYPNNADAYDAMADYYEMQEDTANALKFVTKAYELSGSDYHKERIEKLK
jgi:hypothetical protein